MKKLPCLFERTFHGHARFTTHRRLSRPELQPILDGAGIPTRKRDGTACMVRGGELFKRYDVKKGKSVPAGAIPCEPVADDVTGHWPHWVRVGSEPESKWHATAWSALTAPLADGTYELCGPHFSANPEGCDVDTFFRHGAEVLTLPAHTFDAIREYLKAEKIEGIVFWVDGDPVTKIRRADFGLAWNTSRATPGVVEGEVSSV